MIDPCSPLSALAPQTRELVALGICVAMGCDSYLQWRAARVAGTGASREEILEVIQMGLEMAGDTAVDAARKAIAVVDEIFEGYPQPIGD